MDLSDENILGFSKRDLCTAIAILPAEFFEYGFENCKNFYSFAEKQIRNSDFSALFTSGSSLHSNHVYAEACFRTLGKKIVVIQHGSCGGYTYTSPLIRWISFVGATDIVTNYRLDHEVDPYIRNKYFRGTLFSIFLCHQSLVRKLRNLKLAIKKTQPRVLIALGAIYRFNPLNECFYSYDDLECYSKKIIQLVETLSQSGVTIDVRNYDSASTESNLSL